MDFLSWPIRAGEGHSRREILFNIVSSLLSILLRPVQLYLQIHTMGFLVKFSITYFYLTVGDSLGSTLGEELGFTDGELLGILLLGATLGFKLRTELGSELSLIEVEVVGSSFGEELGSTDGKLLGILLRFKLRF